MAHEYCVCDSGVPGYSCSCSGISYSCNCNSYGGGSAANIWFANHTSSGCPSNIYTPTNTYSSSDISTLYSLLQNDIKSGENIKADTISTLWNVFLNMIDYKKEKNNANYEVSYSYGKPSDINSGKVIKSEHFDHLKDNISSSHSGGYSLNNNTGTGFTDPDGVTIRSISDVYTTDYNTGSVIKANDVAKLAKWIGASYYHCVCNTNTDVMCCTCNIVCDCNY